MAIGEHLFRVVTIATLILYVITLVSFFTFGPSDS